MAFKFEKNSIRKAALAVVSLVLLSACPGANSTHTTYEYMPDMADGASVKDQEMAGRVPPAGTRPRGASALAQGDLAAATNGLPLNRATLIEGQRQFNTYCIACHGSEGDGRGTIVPKFPMPPTLHSDKVRGWSDGQIYAVITKGQNLMPSYATQVNPNERWAIISYIRALQRAKNPTEADVEAYNAALKNKTNP